MIDGAAAAYLANPPLSFWLVVSNQCKKNFYPYYIYLIPLLSVYSFFVYN